MASAVVQSLLTLPMIPLVRLGVDRALPRGDGVLLALLAVTFAGARAFAGGGAILSRALVARVKGEVVLGLRLEMLAELYRRPYRSHVDAGNAPFAGHIILDVQRVEAMIDVALSAVLPAALTGLVLTAALLFLDSGLVALAAALSPLVVLVGRWAGRRMRANFDVYHQAQDRLVRGVRFALDAFALTRARAAEAAELQRQTAILRDLREATTHLAIDNAWSAQLQSLAAAAAGMIILVAGGLAVGRHAMTLGGLLAFLAAAGLISGQIDRLIAALPVIIEGMAAFDRIRAHTEAAPPPPFAGRGVIDWSGALALEGVTFAHEDAPVLRNLSLALGPGERVAIVGANGAGKTTILNLFLGLYRPDQGRQTADGVPFDELDLARLRRRIGLVPQHPVFFSGGLFENVAYGAPGVTRADVMDAAARIGAEGLLDRLSGGLDAPLGEGGLRLSGGERQTIALLRALVVRPRLLMLDEPTNHLDAAAMAALIGALGAEPDRPGILLVSHDLALADRMERVYRLEAGQLWSVTVAAPGAAGG